MVKYRNITFKKGDKGSKEWVSKDTMPILYGMQFVNYDNPQLIITEGQIDSLSLTAAGIENALSVPMGKNNFEWINTCWDFLQRFDEIVVFGDCENGEVTLAKEISQRLKHHKIRIIKTTGKTTKELLGYCETTSPFFKIINGYIRHIRPEIPTQAFVHDTNLLYRSPYKGTVEKKNLSTGWEVISLAHRTCRKMPNWKGNPSRRIKYFIVNKAIIFSLQRFDSLLSVKNTNILIFKI